MSRSVVGPQEIAAIIDLHKAVISYKDIAKQKGLGVRTVQRWVKRFEDSCGTCVPVPLPKPGRPRITSPRTLKVIHRQLKADPSLSAPEIKARNHRLLGHVSLRTVQQHIHDDLLLRSYKARKKPLLIDRHKSRRLQFTKKFSAWDIEQSKKVLWTDEATFFVTGSGAKRVYCPPGSDAHLRNTHKRRLSILRVPWYGPVFRMVVLGS
ncbi:uncharacterized protein [Palaemon carinicauda]|uniref:uncharacterized protein n=1 Tax=Palaemon carinicauda TaxID=392227 RepID=UPI0035B65093